MIVALYKLYLRHDLRYIGRMIGNAFNMILRAIILVLFAQAFASSSIAMPYGLTAMLLLVLLGDALRDVAFYFREQEYFGTFYRIFASPANRIVLILSRALASLTLTLVDVLIIILVGILIGVRIPLGVLFRVTALNVRFISFSFSLAIAPIGIFAKNVTGQIINVVQTTIYLLAGVFFPVEILPGPLRSVAAALPFTKAFEAFRGAAVYSRPSVLIIKYTLESLPRSAAFLAIGAIVIRLSEEATMKYGYERLRGVFDRGKTVETTRRDRT